MQIQMDRGPCSSSTSVESPEPFCCSEHAVVKNGRLCRVVQLANIIFFAVGMQWFGFLASGSV